ncbi:MAG: hypothetical protein ABIO72_06090 [Patescibacteria group bacterium]
MRIPRYVALPLFVIPWVAALVMVVWIIINRFPPNGMFVATTDFTHQSAFINPFLPSERVTSPGAQPEGWLGQRITGDPTYMTARVPGPYDSVTVEMEFRPVHQPLLEFGLVKDAAGLELDLAPFYFEGLVSKSWKRVSNGFVRNGTDASRLLNSDTRGLATWDASATMPLLSDPASPSIETPVSLRGAHDFYLIPSNGLLDVTLQLQDANRSRGGSVAVFRVFRGEDELQREVLDTSGSRDTRMGKVFDHRVTVKQAAPGVYRVAFQSDDDVFIRSIKTTSQHWVVGPRLNFGDVVGYATTTMAGVAWTTSRHVVAETLHAEGQQVVLLGDKKVNVARTHEAFRLDRDDSGSQPVTLSAPKGDIRFVGDGWFALRPEAYFDPKPKRLTDATDLDAEHINGILTSYTAPDELGDGWYRAKQTFTLDPSLDRLRFVLSAPGVLSRVGAVDIRRVNLTYHREALTFSGWIDLVHREIVNAWHRL